MNNSQFVTEILSEFINVWNCGGEASLNLTTSSGFVNVSFNLRHGHPGALFSNSSLSTPPHTVRRHRGPVQKERNCQRASHHQATKTSQQSVTTAPEVASTEF